MFEQSEQVVGADDALAIDQWLSELTLDDVREAISVAHGGGPHASWNHYFGGTDRRVQIRHSRSLLDAAGDAASAAMQAASAAQSAASNVGQFLCSPGSTGLRRRSWTETCTPVLLEGKCLSTCCNCCHPRPVHVGRASVHTRAKECTGKCKGGSCSECRCVGW